MAPRNSGHTSHNTESVVIRRGDGHWLSRLKSTGLPLLVLSSETNPVVAARCRKLGIQCIFGQSEKSIPLERWLEEKGLFAWDTVYVGNGANDLTCMAMVGCPVAVADAEPDVRQAARFVLRTAGGKGAVAEICRLILASKERETCQKPSKSEIASSARDSRSISRLRSVSITAATSTSPSS